MVTWYVANTVADMSLELFKVWCNVLLQESCPIDCIGKDQIQMEEVVLRIRTICSLSWDHHLPRVWHHPISAKVRSHVMVWLFQTFLSLNLPILFIVLGLIPLLFAYFHTSDISKAKLKGIHWRRTTRKDQLLLMWSWHFPPIDDVATVPQLFHAIGLAPVHHNLQTC